MSENDIYKPKEFAKKIGVSVKTLQRWDREGILTADRSVTNRRYYTDKHYYKFKSVESQALAKHSNEQFDKLNKQFNRYVEQFSRYIEQSEEIKGKQDEVIGSYDNLLNTYKTVVKSRDDLLDKYKKALTFYERVIAVYEDTLSEFGVDTTSLIADMVYLDDLTDLIDGYENTDEEIESNDEC